MSIVNQLKRLAKDNLLYDTSGRIRLGSEAIYKNFRAQIEDMYDHGGYDMIKRVKPGEVPTQNVKVHNYRKLYFVIDKNYKYMYVYLAKL